MRSAPRNADIAALADAILEAQDTRTQRTPMSSVYSDFGLASAYRVAHLLRARRVQRGARPVGRKIGFTNARIWPEYGVHAPIWGTMYDQSVRFHAPSEHRCALGEFTEPKIEPEVAFCFREAPPRSGDLADLLACVEWVTHGFEIVHSLFPGWRFEAADTVAAGGLHGALLLGEPVLTTALGPDPLRTLADFRLTLFRNETRIETATGRSVLGHPLLAIQHLIALLADDPDASPIAAGEIITTGTVTAAYAVQVGERWRTEIEGIELKGLGVVFE